MNGDGILFAIFMDELAAGFQKGDRLDVADSAANLDDRHIDFGVAGYR